MSERNIATEVLQGLREIQEHLAGKRTLRTTRVLKPPTVSQLEQGARSRSNIPVSRVLPRERGRTCR